MDEKCMMLLIRGTDNEDVTDLLGTCKQRKLAATGSNLSTASL